MFPIIYNSDVTKINDTKKVILELTNDKIFTMPKNIQFNSEKNYNLATPSFKNLVESLSTETVNNITYYTETTVPNELPEIYFTDLNDNVITSENPLTLAGELKFGIFSNVENLKTAITFSGVRNSSGSFVTTVGYTGLNSAINDATPHYRNLKFLVGSSTTAGIYRIRFRMDLKCTVYSVDLFVRKG